MHVYRMLLQSHVINIIDSIQHTNVQSRLVIWRLYYNIKPDVEMLYHSESYFLESHIVILLL